MSLKLIETADLSFKVLRPQDGRNLPEILYRLQFRGLYATRADEGLECLTSLRIYAMQAVDQNSLKTLQKALSVAITALKLDVFSFENFAGNPVSEDACKPVIRHFRVFQVHTHALEISCAAWVLVDTHAALLFVGLITLTGHTAPSGQFSSNHRIAELNRDTVRSEPDLIAVSFLLSSNNRLETVLSSRPRAFLYASASVRMCEVFIIMNALCGRITANVNGFLTAF